MIRMDTHVHRTVLYSIPPTVMVQYSCLASLFQGQSKSSAVRSLSCLPDPSTACVNDSSKGILPHDTDASPVTISMAS
jgi:hypothetical protein